MVESRQYQQGVVSIESHYAGAEVVVDQDGRDKRYGVDIR